MKKFLSILLTLTMIFGLLAVVPVSAATSYTIDYTNDFQDQSAHGGVNTTYMTQSVEAESEGSDNYIVKFTTLEAAANANNLNFSIYKDDGTSHNGTAISAGSTVTMSLKIKIPQELRYGSNASETCYVQWLVYGANSEGTNSYLYKDNKSRLTFSGTNTTDWQSISSNFEVQEDVTLADAVKLRFGTTGAPNKTTAGSIGGVNYLVDDIVFQVTPPATVEPEPEPEPDTTNYIVNYTNDFEAKTKIGAATSPLTMEVVEGGNNSSYAAKFTAGSGTTRDNAHFIPYANGSNIATSSKPVTFTAGSTLTTSLDIKLPQALVYGSNQSTTCYVQWLIKYVNAEGKDAYVGTESRMSFDGSNTTSWQSLSATIDFDTDTVVKEIKLRFGTTGAANYLASNTSSTEGMEYLVDNIVFQVAAPATETITGTSITEASATSVTVASETVITDAVVIWAVYGDNNKMIDYATATISVTAGGTNTATAPKTLSAGTVKVMLWQDTTNCVPLADVYPVQ